MAWMKQNIGTLIVGLIMIGIVTAIVVWIIRKKRKGKPVGCDCACKNCPKSISCKPAPKETKIGKEN